MTESPEARPTLARLAKLAGVSRATASRALRGDPGVSAETAAQVRQVAQQTGYRVNTRARALRSGSPSPQVIAVIADRDMQLGLKRGQDLAHTYWFRIFFGLWDELSKRGYTVVTIVSEAQLLLPALPLSAIFSATSEMKRSELVSLRGDAPIITVGRPNPTDDEQIKGYIDYDHAQTTVVALEHLWEQGARHLALIYRDDHAGITTVMAAQEWIRKHDGTLVLILDDQEEDTLTQDVTQAVHDGVDGIYAFVPESFSTIAGVAESGLEIGKDVLVIAHSEGVVEAKLRPSVTTISPQAFEAVEDLVAMIQRVIATGDREEITCRFRLEPRESTKGPLRPRK